MSLMSDMVECVNQFFVHDSVALLLEIFEVVPAHLLIDVGHEGCRRFGPADTDLAVIFDDAQHSMDLTMNVPFDFGSSYWIRMCT